MSKNLSRRKFLKYIGAGTAAVGSLGVTNKVVGQTKAPTKRPIPTTPIKIGCVNFLTGPAAAMQGIPATNTYKMLADVINKEGGILGRKIDLLIRDEAGGADAMVKITRKLVLEDKVEASFGYISSGDALAALPLADELGCLIIGGDCGTYHLLEREKSPFEVPKFKLGFRTAAHVSNDSISMALMIKRFLPKTKTIAGINPDYSWGRDCWGIFEAAMKRLMPRVQVVKVSWPPLYTTDYTAHISALMGAKPDVVMSSLWAGDCITFIKQAAGMGFFEKIKTAWARGDTVIQELGKDYPEGQIINCGGSHYFLYPPHDQWPLNKWFVEEYFKRYGKYPGFPCYHAYQIMYSYKYAVEKAAKLVDEWPEVDQVAEAMTGLSFQTPSGVLSIREDHSANEDGLVGFTKRVPGYPFPILDPERLGVFPTNQVNPPVGIRTLDWINSWKG